MQVINSVWCMSFTIPRIYQSSKNATENYIYNSHHLTKKLFKKLCIESAEIFTAMGCIFVLYGSLLQGHWHLNTDHRAFADPSRDKHYEEPLVCQKLLQESNIEYETE